MKKPLKILLLLLLIIILLVGCAKEHKPPNMDSNAKYSNSPNESLSTSSSADYNTKVLYPEGIPKGETISMDAAVDLVIKKFKNEDNDSVRYSGERIEFINGRVYYIFRRFEDKPTHITTLGYYAVDVFTGEVFDTKMLTDLVKLD